MTTTVRRFPLRDLAKTLERDMKSLRQQIVKGVHKTASTGKLVAQANAPEAFGELRDGIIDIPGADGATIRSTAPYSEAVEVGSRPHMPPIAPILAWVRLRGMQGVHGANTNMATPRAVASMIAGRGSSRSTPSDAAERVAWAIALSIKKKGTRPEFFMQTSLPEVMRLLDTYLRDFLEQPLP